MSEPALFELLRATGNPAALEEARAHLRREAMQLLCRVEAALGPATATALAIELAGGSLAFVADHASTAEERGQVADGVRFLADSMLLRHPAGTA